jgi:hypothetical protein
VSWHPNDLIADRDLVDYEARILDDFGVSDWGGKRTKVLEDWLFPILRGQGFNPERLRTRVEPAAVLAFTAAAYSDVTAAARDTTSDDLDLAAIFATPASDVLYIGATDRFRGLWVRILDSVSSVAGTLTVKYWNGQWKALSIADGTSVGGKTLSAGGSVTWTLPVDWATRPINGSVSRYWARVSVSATPTGALATQVGCIRASVLRAPAVLRALSLIFREAPASQEGPFAAKATYYESEADAALQRALAICAGEFDTDASELVSAAEAAQSRGQVSMGYRLLRG